MKKKGFTLIELLVVIAIIAMLLAILMPALSKVKKIAMRVICGTNLKGLGTAQTVYAHDYDDQYTVQGGKTRPNLGSFYPLWNGVTASDWSNPALSGFNISVGTSLYLLVREADVSPASFVCPASTQQEFDGKNPNNLDLVQLWDFGDPANNQGPQNCVSYAFHQPYVAGDTTQTNRTPGMKSRFAANGMRSSAFATMADRSPFYDPKLTLSATVSSIDFIDKATFLNGGAAPTGGNWESIPKYLVQVANSQPHDREGQNVLFADGHNSYEDRSDVSVKNDNIYTPWNITVGSSLTNEIQWRIGGSVLTPSAGYGRGNDDSVLVNDGRW